MTFPDVVQVAVPFFVVMVLLEMLIWRFGHKGAYETRDMAASLSMGFGNSVLRLVLGGFVATLYGAVHQYALIDIGYAWWAFVAVFLLEDLTYYWFHRISHERRWFWASHVVHHSSQHYNLSTALRQTWTGQLGLTFVFWLPLVWIGFEPALIALFTGISLVYQFWIHTEVIDRMGPLEWIFNTPSHHRVHHATNPQYLDANYAGVLIIWDRLFGSFVEEDRAEPPRYGIISNLTTFNPFKIAFIEWASLFRDVWRAECWRDRWMYIWGPPGWSPDGSRRTSKMIKQEAGLEPEPVAAPAE